jgi:lipoprotein-anchoring transpeptidase ErfK/SrfK
MRISRKSVKSVLLPVLAAVMFGACQAPADGGPAPGQQGTEETRSAPAIEVAPVEGREGDYRIITSDTLTMTVNAPEASQAELLYRPVTASDRWIRLRTLTSEAGGPSGRFEAEMQTPVDMNGEIWARVAYPDGTSRETERILVSSHRPREGDASGRQPQEGDGTAPATGQSQAADDHESARSDRKTGGRIETAKFQPGNGNVRVTVNVPAFLMTLWQDGKEVRTYPVGVGRKEYPIPSGSRTAGEIILNPNWIPPDSEWVRSSGVEPYEKVPPGDPGNPLGKIKFPLGNAYLLHEAQSDSDIGSLVSHGCVRVLRDDLYEMTKLIARARGLSVTDSEIEASRKNNERRVIDLGTDLPVDINYDTMVVEAGILYIYPDVYEKNANTVEELRAELEAYRIDDSAIDDATLRQILGRVSPDQKFVVSLEDIRAGRAAERGRTEPVTPHRPKGATGGAGK